jgi:hypothetical protein
MNAVELEREEFSLSLDDSLDYQYDTDADRTSPSSLLPTTSQDTPPSSYSSSDDEMLRRTVASPSLPIMRAAAASSSSHRPPPDDIGLSHSAPGAFVSPLVLDSDSDDDIVYNITECGTKTLSHALERVRATHHYKLCSSI